MDQRRPDGFSLTSLGVVRQDLERALDEVARRGIRWEGTRFRFYLNGIAKAATGPFPKSMDFDSDRDSLLQLCEAIGQAGQLIASAAIWSEVDRDILQGRLRTVVAGPAMPGMERGRPDACRNALFELAVGGMLRRGGFTVQLTEDEDLIVSAPGLVALPVECKRPWAEETVAKNVSAVATQLRSRTSRYTHGGIAAIGVDRAVGIAGAFHQLASEAHLKSEVSEVVHSAAVSVIQFGGKPLREVAPLIFVVLAGGVVCREPTRFFGILRGVWAPLDDGTPKRASIIRHFQKTLSRSPMLLST